MQTRSLFLILLLATLIPQLTFTQGSIQHTEDDIFAELKRLDSILFHAGFVTCDFETLKSLLAEDLEFYHDLDGKTTTSRNFVDNMRQGICAMEFPPRRELIEESLKVYPLKDNDVLYGAIQNGVHRFYERYGDTSEKLVGIAKFSHLWIIHDDQWKLSRVLSYDHGPAGE